MEKNDGVRKGYIEKSAGQRQQWPLRQTEGLRIRERYADYNDECAVEFLPHRQHCVYYVIITMREMERKG